jgi:hypothetical protein
MRCLSRAQKVGWKHTPSGIAQLFSAINPADFAFNDADLAPALRPGVNFCEKLLPICATLEKFYRRYIKQSFKCRPSPFDLRPHVRAQNFIFDLRLTFDSPN